MDLAKPQSETAAAEAPAVSWLRWGMVGFAFFATVVNYLDRQVLGLVAASPGFKASIHISDKAYGDVGAAFMLAYAISNGLSGPFIDAVGTRIGYACCMVWWSLASILHSLVRGPWTLGGFQFLLGAGEAGNWPAAAKLVSEWFPAKERALASGIFNAGASIGAVIAPLIISWIIRSAGWRCAFVSAGLLGLVWVASWWIIYRAPKHATSEAKQRPVPALRLLRTRFVLYFTLSKVFMDPVWYFLIFWFPKYLAEVHHFDMKAIGRGAWVPFFSAALGNLAGGLLTSALIRNGVEPPRARKVSTTIFALAMMSSIPASFTANAPLAIGLISITTFGYTGYTANTLAFPADVFPKAAVASVWGLASMGSGFGGMLFMALSGRCIERFGYASVFIGYGIMPLLALFCILFLIGPLRPDPRFQTSATPA